MSTANAPSSSAPTMIGLRSIAANCPAWRMANLLNPASSAARALMSARAPARAPQDRRALDARDHVERIRMRQRRHFDDRVLQHLDENSAKPEHHCRPEQRIAHHPGKGFGYVRLHRLNQRARPRQARPAGIVYDEAIGFGDGLVIGTTEHAADVSLVQQAGRLGFHRHRKPNVACGNNRLPPPRPSTKSALWCVSVPVADAVCQRSVCDPGGRAVAFRSAASHRRSAKVISGILGDPKFPSSQATL